MSYIETATNTYPLSEADIRRRYPNTTFPKPFKKEGYDWVFPSPKPTLDPLEIARESIPTLTDKGTWEQTWTIVDKFQDDPEGLTKEEQEQEYLEATSIKKIQDSLIALKTEFEGYLYGHYGPATQMTMIKVYADESTSLEVKAKAKEVGDWIALVQKYYVEKQTEILDGVEDATWNFTLYDDIKPTWNFRDFV